MMNITLLLLLPVVAPLAAIWWIYSDASKQGDRQPLFWIVAVGASFFGGFLVADLSHSIFVLEYILTGNHQGLPDHVVLTSVTVNTLVELMIGTAMFTFYIYWEERGIFG